MPTDRRRRKLGRYFVLIGLILPTAARGAEWSLTVVPNASIDYRGEGKVQPETYVNRVDGASSPLYRLEVTQDKNPKGYWGLALYHTGVFGGGAYGTERVPDNTTGGIYQADQLNVGFTNLFITYHRALAKLPVEALVNFSVVRQIFKRKDFIVDGVDARPDKLDDVNEISAEGLGFGLAGRHGGKFYARWQTSANYYVQIFDAKTDPSAGQIFLLEGGPGMDITKDLSLEAGYFYQYWFTHGQGNRRIHVDGTDGAVISWNRQETLARGAYLRLAWRFREPAE